MAIQVRIPKEITEYKEKIIFGLSIRQLICFTLALIIGGGVFALFTIVFGMSVNIAGYFVMLFAAPVLAVGFIRKNGYPFEKYAVLMLRHFIGVRKRPYKTELDIELLDAVLAEEEKTMLKAQESAPAQKVKLGTPAARTNRIKERRRSERMTPPSRMPGGDNSGMKKLRRAEKAPKTAQNTIRYRRMFEEGICEIEPGLYSKTIMFSDINYQIAMRDAQVEIFTRWCTFLNYFAPSIRLQLSVINRHVDRNVFRDTMLLKPAADRLGKYRDEINRMLSEKALEGQNSILREKYLTFTCSAGNYEAAVASLARLETDITSNFKALGCKIKTLTGLERVELLHHMFRPQEPFIFKYSHLVKNGHSTKDYVAPDGFNFTQKDHYEFGDQYGATLYLRDLSPDLEDTLITELSDIPCNMTITLHINSVEQDKALDLVNRKIAFMEQQKIDEQKKAQKAGYDVDMIPYELRHSMEEAEELRDDLKNKNQRMFKVTFLVNTSAATEEELRKNISQIVSTARKHNCNISGLNYQQEDGVNSSAPIGKNHVDIKRTLTTASTAVFVPFTTQELFQPGGIYYGLNALSRKIIIHDRKTLQNSNGFILGKSGSGKSFSAKREMVYNLLNTDDEVIVVDPEREYTILADGFDGEVIRISAGSKSHINPMDITMNYSGEDNPLLLKSEFLLTLCELLIGGMAGLDAAQRSVLGRACTISYQQYFENPGVDTIPTLKDFYNVLVKQPEPEAQRLVLSLEIYIQGTLSVFANKTNVNTTKRLVVYDTMDLGKELKTMGMLIVLDQIWNRITKNRAIGRNTWIYIDEIYLLFKNDYSANYLQELYKRARKWGGIPTGITQNVEDLLLSDLARTMLSNSEFILMLDQAASDREALEGLLKISPEQMHFVTNAEIGQGLLIAGNAIIPFIDKFPKDTELYRMMTTKPDELRIGRASQ